MRYACTFTAEIEIEAENIVQARRLADRISTVRSNCYGWRADKSRGHRYSMKCLSEKSVVTRAKGEP